MVVDAMKYCLTLKYEQSEAFRKELERSRGKYIVETKPPERKAKRPTPGGPYTKATNTWAPTC